MPVKSSLRYAAIGATCVVGVAATVLFVPPTPVQITDGARHSLGITNGADVGKTLAIYNPNPFTVSVSLPAASGCACLRAAPLPMVLSAGQSASLAVSLEPEAEGEHTLAVRLVTTVRHKTSETPLYLSYNYQPKH